MKRKAGLAVVVLLCMLGTAAQALDISTEFGQGADTWVCNGSSEKSTVVNGAATELRARYIGGGTRCSMTYLRFDISQQAAGDFTGTTLSLTATYLKGTTGRRLDVYGLVDETLDSWVEATTCYANAPGMLTPDQGNDLGFYKIDDTKLTWLGYFICPAQSVPVPAVFNTDPALLNLGSFLNQDTNNLATLVIINATGTSGTNSENRFASKDHATLAAPTLVTPEPATLVLLGLGSLMTICRKRG